MTRTRTKICGITREEDALAAAQHGADAIGFIFWPRSERCVTPARMAEVMRVMPPLVTPVAVFVNPGRDEVGAVLDAVPNAVLQFHGEEEAGFCASFSRPWIKAARARPGLDLLKYFDSYMGASAWMIDAFHEQVYGGTGSPFDWSLVPRRLSRPWMLSGGLDALNVTGAIREMRPWGVDVSSGVEAARGIKDAARIAAFLEGVRRADA